MPRRRRNQKLRKINDKNGQNICIRAPSKCVDDLADPLIDNTARTCVENDSLNRTAISAISGVLIRTPTPDMIIHENELISPLKTTPLNSRIRATSIEQYSKKFNVTNLNIIFNGSLNNSVDYHSVTSFRGDELKISDKRSLSKSPILTAISNQTELLKNCKATQTSEKSMDGSPVSSRNKEPIMETPKVRRYSSLKIGSKEIPRIDVKELESENNCKQEFNINPYLNKQMKIGFRESIDEISFFTPELFKNKPASTPVDIVNTKKFSNCGNHATQQKTTEYGAKPSFLCSSSTPKVENKTVPSVGKHFREKYLSRSFPYTKRYPTNDSLDSFNKYLDAFSSSRALISKSLTPKRTVLCTRCYSRKYLTTKHLNYCCRTFEYNQVFQGHINETLCSQNFGLFERIINRLKRYSRISARWSMRLVEMCAFFGIAIKTSLTNLYKLYGPSNMVEKETEPTACDHCSSYRKEIDALNTKIEHLYSTLDGVKSMLDENKRDNERKAEELKVLSCEVEQFKSFKQEWETWKNKHTLSNYVPPPVAPLLPPPPPPPLPPPLPFTPGASQSMGSIKSTNKNKKLKRAETARPIISLDDILKVKLKKAGERPNPLRRASNPPVVSIEMLKQVKLRPSVRQATPSVRQATPSVRQPTPSSIPDTSSGSSTSPHSALKRLLSENTVGKVKRLRRVGGYSFDDICRRNLTAKYSRDRTYD